MGRVNRLMWLLLVSPGTSTHRGTIDRRAGTVMVLTDEGFHVQAQMFGIPIGRGVDLPPLQRLHHTLAAAFLFPIITMALPITPIQFTND